MQIHGFQKTTLLDYPGHVAATIFTGGCNFRCPFCHNGDLVLHPGEMPLISEDEILSFFQKRRNILDGVCITGGEPTLQPDLEAFVRKIKMLGFAVKLDTNGSHPDLMMDLCEQGLIDYVAMDIKQSLEKYTSIIRMPSVDLTAIQTSVDFLKSGAVAYEFRTTLVKELHEDADIVSIGKWLAGADSFFLQSYRDSDSVIERGFHAHESETLLHFRELLTPFFKQVALRGVD